MKKLAFLVLTLTYTTISAQNHNEKLSIVEASFENIGPLSGIQPPSNSINFDALDKVKSLKDLNKIIADTPFLSIVLRKTNDDDLKDEVNHPKPESRLILGERLQPEKASEGTWVLLMQNEDQLIVSIPRAKVENLEKHFNTKDFVVINEKGKLKTMIVSEIILHQ